MVMVRKESIVPRLLEQYILYEIAPEYRKFSTVESDNEHVYSKLKMLSLRYTTT